MPQLRDNYLERAASQRLSRHNPCFAAIVDRHASAVAEGEPCYLDPASGLSVFTAAFLAARGYCCDSGCRHCPFVID
ncbi:MAG: DUF5522 domain-containing protein [Actinomycetota bacterium]|nr:DUF5522 domain-containing protein [Actinomycetota bacterium]